MQESIREETRHLLFEYSTLLTSVPAVLAELVCPLNQSDAKNLKNCEDAIREEFGSINLWGELAEIQNHLSENLSSNADLCMSPIDSILLHKKIEELEAIIAGLNDQLEERKVEVQSLAKEKEELARKQNNNLALIDKLNDEAKKPREQIKTLDSQISKLMTELADKENIFKEKEKRVS